MPSAQTVSQIKSKLLNPATTSHFSVVIQYPSFINDPNKRKEFNDTLSANGIANPNLDRLQLLCSEATLPGSNLATLELTNDHTGVTERHAYRRVYDDRIDLTFYVDAEDYLPIRFFESWLKYISTEGKTPDMFNIGASAKDAKFNYRFKYRDDYASDGLKVQKFEKSSLGNVKGKPGTQFEYGFVKAYPISISSMPVSYDSSSLLKCMVSFTYIRYYVGEVEDANTSQNTSTPLQALTPEQTARINSVAFNPNTNLGLDYEKLTTTGGVSLPTANSSGNTVKRAFSGVSLF